MSKKKRNKKYNPRKNKRQHVVGLQVAWSDTSPHMDTEGFIFGSVKHRNAIHSAGVHGFYAANKDWIVQETAFMWRITMTLVFQYPNGLVQRETTEMDAFIILRDLGSISLDLFHEAMRHGNAECYTHTEFIVECTGHHPKTTEEAA